MLHIHLDGPCSVLDAEEQAMVGSPVDAGQNIQVSAVAAAADIAAADIGAAAAAAVDIAAAAADVGAAAAADAGPDALVDHIPSASVYDPPLLELMHTLLKFPVKMRLPS